MTPTEFYQSAYDILVDCCAAPENLRASFVSSFVDAQGHSEFRFMGSLGMGGKIYADRISGADHIRRLSVACYGEDETPARLAAIEAASARLAVLLAADPDAFRRRPGQSAPGGLD